MKNATRKEKILWAVLIAAPLLMGFYCQTLIPEGVVQIPSHWDLSGNINGYSTPEQLPLLGGIMSAVNALDALCYFYNDKLYDAGLVNGVSRKGALKVYVAVSAILVIITAIIYAVMMSNVSAAL